MQELHKGVVKYSLNGMTLCTKGESCLFVVLCYTNVQ